MSSEKQKSDYKTWNWHRWGIVVILAAFIVLSLSYSLINPLYEATDELRHYRFVRTLATEQRLPIQGQESCRSQGHHPPLFYALGAAATFWIESNRDICDTPEENPFWAYRYWEVGRDNKNQYFHGLDENFPWYGDALAAHIVRAINVLIGAGAVFLTWQTGRKVWPNRQGLALGAAGIMAFNPMFLYMAGAINNDIIAAMAGAAVTFTCITILLNPSGLHWKWGLILGVIFGLALLSKFNLIATIFLIEAAISWVAWRKNQWREWLLINLLLVITTGLIAGWWFVRNQVLYGEPTGFQQVTQLWGFREPADSFGLALSELPYAFSTLWGRFGFGQVPLPQIIYLGLFIFVVTGLLGSLVGFVRRADYRERVSLAFLWMNVLLFFAVLFNYMLVSPAGPNGRFFFPALSALTLLLVYGISQLLILTIDAVAGFRSSEPLTRSREYIYANITGFVAGIGMIALAIIVLVGYLRPAYARPPSLADNELVPNPENIQFDQLVTLLGYDVSATKIHPGEFLDIDLYWEVNNQPPGDYLLFVHLLDEQGTIVAQRDTHPGLGNFPASQWRANDRFVESIRMYVPETAYVPAEATLNIGLYAPDSYRLAVTGEDGRALGDSFQLSAIQLLPEDSQFPNPQAQSFNDEIMLVGYEYNRKNIETGHELLVTVYWEALQDVSKDYIAQVRLVGADGRVVSSDDKPPGSGLTPTSMWLTGDILSSTHKLEFDPSTPSGSYLVDLALADAISNQRVNIVAPDGHWIDNHLILAPIRIDS